MPKRIIDLTLTIVPADSWIQFPRKLAGTGRQEPPTKIEAISTIEEYGVLAHRFETTTQSFTHIDAPRHFFKDGLTNDEVPLERLIGEAVVIDMLYKKPKEAVTAKDLENSRIKVKKGDIAIIRTGWTDKAWGTKKFWEEMIWLSEDACDWLIDKGIKALAQDFFTDVYPFLVCEKCGALLPSSKGSPNHHKFLKNGIILIEWCTNLIAIKKQRVTLICLPLKLKGTDGAPARVIAIEDE